MANEVVAHYLDGRIAKLNTAQRDTQADKPAAEDRRQHLWERQPDVPDAHIAGEGLLVGQHVRHQRPVHGEVGAVAEPEDRARRSGSQ